MQLGWKKPRLQPLVPPKFKLSLNESFWIKYRKKTHPENEIWKTRRIAGRVLNRAARLIRTQYPASALSGYFTFSSQGDLAWKVSMREGLLNSNKAGQPKESYQVRASPSEHPQFLGFKTVRASYRSCGIQPTAQRAQEPV